jgi:hypothetical protein
MQRGPVLDQRGGDVLVAAATRSGTSNKQVIQLKRRGGQARIYPFTAFNGGARR